MIELQTFNFTSRGFTKRVRKLFKNCSHFYTHFPNFRGSKLIGNAEINLKMFLILEK